MPLHDHFRPPLDTQRHWGGFHATWPVMIVAQLRPRLPPSYFAEPRTQWGKSAEIDVIAYEREQDALPAGGNGNGGVAIAVWAPPRPALSVVTELPAQDAFEVLVYDEQRHSRLVAAIELVSPANKDRMDQRRAFTAKCAGLLREGVSVVVVDIVTTRTPNLYAELLEQIGVTDPALEPEPPLLYAAACRLSRRDDAWWLETWTYALRVGQPLPTLPLWLADALAVPLELEDSYEQSCALLGIP
jgi:hypothetical protein